MKQYDPNISQFIEMSTLYSLIRKETKTLLPEVITLAYRKLKVVDEAFTHYNSHDIHHALRTLVHVEEILRCCGINDITSEEAFILMCACLLHDVGMGPLGPEEDADFKEAQDRKDEWRRNHHTRVRNWICESQGTILDRIDDEIRNAIGEVACGHRKIPILSHKFFEQNERLGFLVAVLRLADQMDIAPVRIEDRFERARESIKLKLTRENPDEPSQQLTEWLKVFATKDWKLTINKTHRNLELTSSILDDELTLRTLSALDELVYDIEETIEQVKDVPWPGTAITDRPLPNTLDVRFSVMGEIEGSTHQLSANYDKVWEYLGGKLYPEDHRSWIPIREAVCNAVDACLRLPQDEKQNALVIVEDLGHELRVHDNGVGMSFDIIENHLKVLASSYYDSAKYKGLLSKTGHADSEPSIIGQFGIGTFSYLLLSHAFEVETKTEEGPAYNVSFSKRFAVTKAGTRGERGTTVYLPCPKRDVSWENTQDLQSLLSKIFPKPRVKIIFVDQNQTQSPIGHFIDSKIRASPTKESKFRYQVEKRYDEYRVGIYMDEDFSSESPLPLESWISDIPALILHKVFKPRSLYVGMNVEPTMEKILPFSFALGSMTIQIPSSNYPFFWVDLERGSKIVNMTKSIFTSEGQEILTGAMESLEELSINILNEILDSNRIGEFYKVRARYATMRYMASKLLTVRSESTALDTPLAAFEIYRDVIEPNKRLEKFLLTDWYCYDLVEGVSSTLGEVIKKNRDKILQISPKHPRDFRKFTGRIDSHESFISFPKDYPNPILPVLVLLPPTEPFLELLRYHVGRLGCFTYFGDYNGDESDLRQFLQLIDLDLLDSEATAEKITRYFNGARNIEVTKSQIRCILQGGRSQFAFEVWRLFSKAIIYDDEGIWPNLEECVMNLGLIFDIPQDLTKEICGILSHYLHRMEHIEVPSVLRSKLELE